MTKITARLGLAVFFFTTAAGAAPRPMTSAELVKRYQAWADQSAPADVKGKKDFAASLAGLQAGFSDAKLVASSSLAAKDYVLVLGRFDGTNDGDMPGMGPMGLKKTGKKIDVTYPEITEFKNGKAMTYWRFYNGLAFATQLGLVPPPAAPAK